ncbi:MAG TPA: prepilin peptidase [Gemmatimonadales bacterium]|nr:prepilin peptidase [Gemmatimonadales bacterium]
MAGDLTLTLFGALLGAVLGSFLNVCILRLPANESVVRPPSRCPKCGYGLRWYDNIPVVSWLLLRGKCRQCAAPISIQYPLIELVTAAIWAGFAWALGPSLEAFRGAIFFTILLGIAMTDAREYIIPDEFSIGGLVLGVALHLPDGFGGIGRSLVGAAVGFGVLWLVAVVGKKVFKEDAMGGGDIKMMAMVGAFTGGWASVLLTIFLGSVLGVLIFVPWAMLRKAKLVPFGVFLAVGAATTYLVGAAIIDWYRQVAFGG